MRRPALTAAACFMAVATMAGCAGSDTGAEKSKAAEFTSRVHRTGVAPHVTQRVARSLYADDGGAACAAVRDNPAGLLLGWGRSAVTATPEEHADDLVAYDRAVVEVYCPDRTGALDDLIGRLNR